MKKNKKIIISVTSVAVILGSVIAGVSLSNKKTEKYDVSLEDTLSAYQLLKNSVTNKTYTYYDFKLENENTKLGNDTIIAEGEISNPVANTFNYDKSAPLNKMEYGDVLSYYVNVSEDGLYEIQADYLLTGDNILVAPTVSITINDEAQYDEAEAITVPLKWMGTEDYDGEDKSFPKDTYGDQTIPLNERDTTTWQVLECHDNTFSTTDPLLFKFKKGRNKISIKYVSGNAKIVLGQAQITAPKKYISYEEYSILHNQAVKQDNLSFYNAIYYNSKNSSYIALANEKNSALVPYNNSINMINVISVDSWDDSGQSITYKINCENDGLYNISLHYQNDKNEFNSFRSIIIDDEIPFNECLNYAFKPTSSGKWANETLSIDNKPMNFYLTKGEHYLTLRADRNNVAPLVNYVQTVIDHINYFSLEILKVTGNEIDEDMTYKLTEYIPETASYLKSYDTLLKYIINEASEFSDKGLDSSSLSYISKAITTLKKLMKKPNELPLYLDNLYSGSSSINQLLGDSIVTLNDQPLGLDSIYVHGNNKLPKANSNFFKKISDGIVRTFKAYTSDKYDTTLDDEVVNVWVNKPLTYINILQQMVDRDFNSKEDSTKIKISMMPDASKLLLSTAAGECPDVALGLASYTPFDFAIRNAAYDLSSFDDFYQIASRFPSGTLTPFVLNDKFYALPESIDFQVTIHRDDIFNSFAIDVPNTWEDLKNILPTLQRYGMNYYLPTSADNSTKWFYQTAFLIYQCGGRLYNDDGLTTAIDSEEALEGLTMLTDLYKYYSLDNQVKSFYNSFRYGTHPIGTCSFSEYLLIKNAAPEITGKWNISSPLGIQTSEGIDRTFISSGSSAMIFKDTTNAESSWDFLKWWTSAETQIEYSNRLQSTYGPEYTWLSANIDAVKESPIDSQDKEVIVDALEWIIDVPRTPGQYMLERGLSNIWTRVALQNQPIGVSIDNEVILINREITRKMKEFNYLDSKGDVLKEYRVREKGWVSDIIKAKTGGNK